MILKSLPGPLCHVAVMSAYPLSPTACSNNDGDGAQLQDDGSTEKIELDFETLRAYTSLHQQDSWIDHPGLGQAVVTLDGTYSNGSLIVQTLLTTTLNQPVYLNFTNLFNPVREDTYHYGTNVPTPT